MVLPLVIAAMIGATLGAASLRAYQYVVLGQRAASLRIETSTPGLDVVIGGKSVGKTPLALSMPAGTYPVQLAGAGISRSFSVDLASGVSVVRHVDVPAASPPADNAVGSLGIQTEPSRLVVSVDGVERGRSPLKLSDLKPGEHQVSVRADGAIIRRAVTIRPNEHTVLVVSPVERPSPIAPNAAGGWLAVTAPVTLSIKESGKLLGTTDSDRLMLPAGERHLEVSNDALGFQAKRTVKIEPGKTAALKIEPPNGTLSINAQPWAEVWVNGTRVGETPIGKLPQPIGTHEVVLRHPNLGERRETVTVTLRQTARLGVDMRRK